MQLLVFCLFFFSPQIIFCNFSSLSAECYALVVGTHIDVCCLSLNVPLHFLFHAFCALFMSILINICRTKGANYKLTLTKRKKKQHKMKTKTQTIKKLLFHIICPIHSKNTKKKTAQSLD